MSNEDVNTSIASRIYLWLRGEFDADRIAPDAKLPSENALGERFGASRPTVRQALARLAHEGSIATVRGQGSRRLPPPPNHSRDVALLLPSLTDYIYPELAEAAAAGLRAAGFHTLFDCSGDDAAVERRILAGLAARRPAGLIISPQQPSPLAPGAAPAAAGNLDLLRRLRAAATRVLLLDNQLGDESFDAIVMADRSGGERAVDFLWERGHRAIGVAWRDCHAPFADRRSGALARLADLAGGLPAWADFRLAADEPVAAALDRQPTTAQQATAYFCANDQLALELIAAFAARGRTVPADFSVLGFDDSPAARAAGLASFAYPSAWIGRRAAELVAAAIAEPAAGRTGPASAIRLTIEPAASERGSVRRLDLTARSLP